MRLTNVFGYTAMLIAYLLLSSMAGDAGEGAPSYGPTPSSLEQTSSIASHRPVIVLRTAAAQPSLRARAKAELLSESEKTPESSDQKSLESEAAGSEPQAEVTQWSGLFMGAAYVLIATLLLLVGIWLLFGARIWLLRRLERTFPVVGKAQSTFAVDLRRQLQQGVRIMTRLVATAAVCVLVYVWLVYVLAQFSYSLPWSEQLSAFLVSLLADIGRGALNALPGLLAVVVIILVARWCVGLINVVFNEIQAGKISPSWMDKETARTTQTLLAVVVWLIALVMAYPYIPGSESEAFKGLSVLLGVMVALGSTGLINQILSGLFVTYSKSVRAEDYVKVGDVEGEVVDVGFLATKLKTPWQEEITIPHSVLVGTATTNYSRLAGDQGMAVTASVTIGYDVPWRQVHALLILGASRTPGIRKEPPPRVLQRNLSDFYVQYLLLAHLEDAKSRATVLSDLHAQIQDAFNEHGTQIMSPHFESQPQNPVIVPRSVWYAPPTPQSAAMTAEPGPVEPQQVEESVVGPIPAEPKPVEPIAFDAKEREHAEAPVKPVLPSAEEKALRKRPILRRNPRAKPPSA
ncbi:MAG: mechanosensitive ion channel domain-containing protein [Candidatus Binatia bacterium]